MKKMAIEAENKENNVQVNLSWKRSSGNLFSFYVSDMSSSVKNLDTKDFMDPHSVSQLADDTEFFADFLDSLRKKFRSILLYSARRYQVPNISKTKYCHFAKCPTHENLIIDEHKCHYSDTNKKVIIVTLIKR